MKYSIFGSRCVTDDLQERAPTFETHFRNQTSKKTGPNFVMLGSVIASERRCYQAVQINSIYAMNFTRLKSKVNFIY